MLAAVKQAEAKFNLDSEVKLTQTTTEFRTEEQSGKHRFGSMFIYLRDLGQPLKRPLKLA